jgi:hypothetical protein
LREIDPVEFYVRILGFILLHESVDIVVVAGGQTDGPEGQLGFARIRLGRSASGKAEQKKYEKNSTHRL